MSIRMPEMRRCTPEEQEAHDQRMTNHALYMQVIDIDVSALKNQLREIKKLANKRSIPPKDKVGLTREALKGTVSTEDAEVIHEIAFWVKENICISRLLCPLLFDEDQYAKHLQDLGLTSEQADLHAIAIKEIIE